MSRSPIRITFTSSGIGSGSSDWTEAMEPAISEGCSMRISRDLSARFKAS